MYNATYRHTVVGVASRLIIAVEAPEAPGSISSSRNESSQKIDA